VRGGSLQVIFDSIPVEIREHSVLLEVSGSVQELPNDYVWIFAGGTAPDEFLRSIGIAFGPRDLTAEAIREGAACRPS
jgi:hypothetical protein